MSIVAGGTIEITTKVPISLDTLGLPYTYRIEENRYRIEFEGNYTLDYVIRQIEILNDDIASGWIDYWSDVGNAKAVFLDGEWVMEWEETYYPGNLPTIEISSTKRVAEILNAIASDTLESSERADAARLIIECGGLTSKEIKLYGLKWLTD